MLKRSWQTKKLGEICDIKTGKKDVNQGNPKGKYPFFTCAKEHTFSDEYSFDTEALLVAGNGDVGNVNYYNGKFEAYQRTYVLSCFKLISPKFLYLFLDGFLKDTVSQQKLGNTMPYIKMGMLTDFKVPLPSTIEQQHIVKILDEAFEKIEKVKKNTEKNLQNSKDIFESYLQNIFTNPMGNWKKIFLGEVSKILMGQSPNGDTYNTKKDGLPLINGPVEFGQGQLGETHITKYTSKPTKICQKGTLILCVRGSTTGKTNIAGYESCLGRGVASITANEKIINQNLLNIYIASMRNTFFSLGTGSTFPNISSNIISKIEISIPPIDEQSDIVSKLEKLSSETKKLELIYKQKLADLEELKKSILVKAFNGDL